MTFADYVRHGWALCRIHEGEKRPRGDGWNQIQNAIASPSVAESMVNGGLLHAFSGTCAIDVDNMDLARVWFRERGIDLDALFAADDAVQIISGDATRGKLIYALPPDDPSDLVGHAKRWPTKKILDETKTITVFELRCGATTGNSAQDVLPPSTNPRTKLRYQWKFNDELQDWCSLPPLPTGLRTLWESLIAPAAASARELPAPSASYSELQQLISKTSPDVSYDEWCKIGMIIHHETEGSDDGLAIWNAWSAAGAKYVGIADLESHWNSFGNASHPATAGSLRRETVASDEDFGPPADQDVLAAAERAAREASRLTLVSLDAFAQRTPVRYLVDGLIEEGQLFGFIGKRKGGKSYAALDLAFAITQGRPWAKHDILQTGPVVWIAAEGARSLQLRRGPQWLAHYGAADIRVWPHALNMRKPETFEGLVDVCRGVKLVVIDSLRRVTPGAKENSSDELAEVLGYAEQLTRETGAAVCFIAHAGKAKAEGDEMSARGTSAIEDALEAGFFIEKLEGDDTGLFRITPGFARDEETGGDAAMHFKLEPITPEGLTPGMIVDWDAQPAAPKREKSAPVKPAATDVLTLKVLNALWPVDGAPVVALDTYRGKYAENITRPAGEDNRVTKADSALDRLAKKGIVEIDNARGTITLLREAALDDANMFGPPVGDPDADIL